MGRAIAAAAIALAVMTVSACSAPSGAGILVSDAGAYRGTEVDPAFAMPSQTFTDTEGARTTVGDALRAADTAPRVGIVIFAYTSCPDVCNTQLAALAAALRKAPDDVRDRVGVVMISTDPARDTPTAIRSYLDGFDDQYVGLRAPLAVAEASGRPLGVAIERGSDTADGGYLVDHTAAMFGFDAQGRGVVIWQPGVPVGDLLDDLKTLAAA